MTWHEITWDAYEKTTRMVSEIEIALDAHPAWSFVEEVIEQRIVAATAEPAVPEYADWVYTIRVWKNSGTSNGVGKDLYVAFATMSTRLDGVSAFAETGYLGIYGMLGYDQVKHHPIDRLGLDAGDPMQFDENRRVKFANDLTYPFFAPMLEPTDTWGTWATRGQALPAPVPLLNATEHLQSISKGTAFEVLVPSSASESLYNLRIRVSKDGLFIVNSLQSDDSNANVVYIGAYDLSLCPDMFRTQEPFIQIGNDGYAFGAFGGARYQQMVEYPGIKLLEADPSHAADDLLGAMTNDRWGFDEYGDGVGRQLFPLPGLEEYAVLPFGYQPLAAYGLGRGTGYTIYNVPGLYFLSAKGVPAEWELWSDTMTSPDGRECVMFALDFSSANVLLIDKGRA